MSTSPNPGSAPAPKQHAAPLRSEAEALLTPEALASQGTQAGAPMDPSTEKEMWTGRSSWRAIYPTVLVSILAIAAIAVLVHVFMKNNAVTLTVVGIGAAVLLILAARTAWGIWSTSYRLTTQRLFIRRGIFSQTVDQTELLRVDDVRVRQSLLQRMLGIGEVEMMSSDTSDKDLRIRDVENPEVIAEHIRRHTRTVQKRTLFMEQI